VVVTVGVLTQRGEMPTLYSVNTSNSETGRLSEVRPRIGITCGTAEVPVAEGALPSHYVGLGYARSVAEAGGIPVLLPAVAGYEGQLAVEYLSQIDGLLLAGGTDIHPDVYGQPLDPRHTHAPDQHRDRFELALVRHARAQDLPILGVCRGFQLLNVACGGTLDQHRPHEHHALAPVPGLRVQVTPVAVESGTTLAQVLGVDQLDVYCLHHQAIGRLAAGLRVAAYAGDGLIEAIEDPQARFTLGVLWHPEQMAEAGALLPYTALVEESRRQVPAKDEERAREGLC
jgi:putative glutamine amidotransferase